MATKDKTYPQKLLQEVDWIRSMKSAANGIQHVQLRLCDLVGNEGGVRLTEKDACKNLFATDEFVSQPVGRTAVEHGFIPKNDAEAMSTVD